MCVVLCETKSKTRYSFLHGMHPAANGYGLTIEPPQKPNAEGKQQ